MTGDVDGPGGSAPPRKPLTGWKVAVTRARRQASALVAALSRAGAEPLAVPTIEVADPEDGGAALRQALGDLVAGRYHWAIFTSENTVERVFRAAGGSGDFSGVRVAAIGPGTARQLRERGVEVELVPGRFVAEALAESFPPATRGAERPRVLLPRAAAARDVLERALSHKGYEVDVVTAYRTVRPLLPPDLVEAAALTDAVAFTASSTVTGWIELLGAERLPPVVACIGPVTAATARRAGIGVNVEAEIHTIDGLVAALEEYAVTNGRP